MYRYHHILLVLLVGILMQSCSWLHDDEIVPCPEAQLQVQFCYDYNLLHADAFASQVGYVRVYVYDSDSRLVKVVDDGGEHLSAEGYALTIKDLPPGAYSLRTFAFHTDPTASGTASAKFRDSAPLLGSQPSSLSFTLDHPAGQPASQLGAALDTLFTQMGECHAVIEDERTTVCRVPLMRQTNLLTVSLRQLDDADAMDIAEYSLVVSNLSSTVCYDGSVGEADMSFAPFALWNTSIESAATETKTKTAATRSADLLRAGHADFSLPRIMADAPVPSRLQIIHNATGAKVADINLPAVLVQGCNSFEAARYTPQEFLDRENSFKLDFFLRGDTWEYIDFSVSVLDWSVRIHNISF